MYDVGNSKAYPFINDSCRSTLTKTRNELRVILGCSNSPIERMIFIQIEKVRNKVITVEIENIEFRQSIKNL